MKFDIKMFSAESLLGDAPILKQIEQIKNNMTYKTEDGLISLEDYFDKFNKDVSSLKTFDLEPVIAPGTEYAYLLRFTNILQEMLDQIEGVSVKGVYFQSRLRSIKQMIDNASSTFTAWYQIALSQALKENDIKIPVSSIKSLGDSEFSRLMDGKDIDIDAMYQAIDIQIGLLKSHKSLAMDKYKMVKDQVNASLSNLSPDNNYGNEHLRPQSTPKLEERYGKFFKQDTKLPVIEDEEDDAPVVFIKHGELDENQNTIDETSDGLLSESQLNNVYQEHVSSIAEEIIDKPFIDPDTTDEEVFGIDPGQKGIVKTSIVEVKPEVLGVVADPFLGNIKLETKEDGRVSVSKTEGKPLVAEDDDEPVPFSKKEEKKDVEKPSLFKKRAETTQFSQIEKAQKEFKLESGFPPAKNIKPKPDLDDLDELV